VKLRKTTSLKIDEELWKEVKIHCIKESKEISEYLEEIIKNDLSKTSSKSKNFEERGGKK